MMELLSVGVGLVCDAEQSRDGYVIHVHSSLV